MLLVIGAFTRTVRWIALPATALALGVGLVSAADLDLEGGVGEREYSPPSASDLRDRYKLGMGQLVVDLRDTSLPAGDTPLKVKLGMGQALVIVPRDVCVTAAADVGAGHVDVLGRESDGVNVDFEDSRRRAVRRHAAGAGRRPGLRRVRRAPQPRLRPDFHERRSVRRGPTRRQHGPARAAMHRPDMPSLVSGLALIGLGTVLLLDRLEMIEMGFGVFGPLLLAALGVMLLTLGQRASRRAAWPPPTPAHCVATHRSE